MKMKMKNKKIKINEKKGKEITCSSNDKNMP